MSARNIKVKTQNTDNKINRLLVSTPIGNGNLLIQYKNKTSFLLCYSL